MALLHTPHTAAGRLDDADYLRALGAVAGRMLAPAPEQEEAAPDAGTGYTVRVVEVGQHFGCTALVLRRGRVVHATRNYPFGFAGSARRAALAWIARQARAQRQQQPQAGAQ